MPTRRLVLIPGLLLYLVAPTLGQERPSSTAAIRPQALNWFRATVLQDKTRLIDNVTQDIDRILGVEGRHVVLLVPSGLSRDGRASFGMSWAGVFHSFPMTDEQGRRAGLSADAVTVGSAAKRRDVRSPQPLGQLDRLHIDQADRLSASQKITGSVVCQLFQEQRQELLLRIAYRTRGFTSETTIPLRTIPERGVVHFTLEPINRSDRNEVHDGPLPVFVDLCVENRNGNDRQLTVVSNTLGTLLDVRGNRESAIVPIVPIGGYVGGIEGTRWRFNGTETVLEFRPGGQYLWNNEAGKGFWKQEGRSITVNANNFTLFRLTLEGDIMTGTWERLQGEEVGRRNSSGLKRIND